MENKHRDHANEAVSSSQKNTVPKSIFDVSHLPLKQAIGIWSEAMETANDIRFLNPPEKKLPTRIEACHMGDAFLGVLESIPQEFKRSRHHIGRGGGDCYAVHFIHDGTMYFPTRDQQAHPGDMIILDRGEPYTLTVNAQTPHTTYHMLALLIPKRLLDPYTTLSEREGVQVYDAKRPMVTLLRQHLYAFNRQLAGMTPDQAQAIIQPTVDLLTATMTGTVTEANTRSFKNAFTQQILRYVDMHIKAPSLSAKTIAAAFQISTRKLYQLFEPFGGVVAYIQKKRLSLVHAAIIDPALQHRRIQEIAEDYGFLHRKNFNAAFRRVYGITPREARAYAAEGHSRNMQQIYSEKDCWEWMLTLR